MAWIESHQSLSRHRKTLRAAALLRCDRHKLIGHLHELWWWALDNVSADGALNGTLDEEIAAGAEWDGEPGAFVDALTRAGFLDATPEGRFIHEWYEFAGKLLDRRDDNRRRQREYRERHRPPPTEPSVRNANVTRYETVTSQTPVTATNAATVPNPTVPTLSPTEREAPDADAPDAAPSQMRLRLPKAQTTDAVRAANTVLGKKCNEAERGAINEGVPATPQAQKLWESVLRTWKLRYERNKGLEGPLEWFAAGGPPPKRVNGAPGGNGQYVQPQSQQRNPGPAPLREPTPEEAAASTAEKERVRRQLEERHLAGRMARIGGPA